MSRRLARTLAMTTGLSLVVFLPTTALAASHVRPAHSSPGHSRPAPKHSKPVPKHTKPAPKHFTLVGTLVSVTPGGAGPATITLTATGGARDIRAANQPVTVTVPATAKVVRRGAHAKVTDLQPGDHVTVVGTRSKDGTLVAGHVNVAVPAASPSPSTSTSDVPQPGATTGPTPPEDPTETGAPAPSATATPAG